MITYYTNFKSKDEKTIKIQLFDIYSGLKYGIIKANDRITLPSIAEEKFVVADEMFSCLHNVRKQKGEFVMLPIVLSSIEIQSDREFMESIYHRYCRLMYSVASTYFPNQPDREDVVQTSLENLVKHVGKLRTLSGCTLTAYIVSTIRNTAYNLSKQNQRKERQCISIEDNPGIDAYTEAIRTDELLDMIHRRGAIRNVLEKLQEEERFLLEGKYILGYSDAELAEIVHCNPASIRMKLTRARRHALNLLILEGYDDKT